MTSQDVQLLSIDCNAASKQALRVSVAKMRGIDLVAEADTGNEALQKLRIHEIDAVLLDLGLPGMDSIGLISRIRKARPGARVLIVTASAAPEDIFAAMDAGADAYVLKENLSSVLEKAIRSARLGAVWLDPGIAEQVLKVIESPAPTASSRILPTGYMPIPLMPNERSVLSDVASGNCKDGVCLVDPSFIKKLRRFSPVAT